MRIRDILHVLKQLAANVISKTTIKGKVPGILEWEISGEGLLELHRHEVLLSKVVNTAFNKRRIFWEPLQHELHFVDPGQRQQVCVDSIEEAQRGFDEAMKDLSVGTAADLKLADLLLNLSSELKAAKGRFQEILTVAQYNAGVLDRNEFIDENDRLAFFIGVIRDLRIRTYPLFASLFDLLPEGHVLAEAAEKLEKTRRELNVDMTQVEQDWDLTF